MSTLLGCFVIIYIMLADEVTGQTYKCPDNDGYSCPSIINDTSFNYYCNGICTPKCNNVGSCINSTFYVGNNGTLSLQCNEDNSCNDAIIYCMDGGFCKLNCDLVPCLRITMYCSDNNCRTNDPNDPNVYINNTYYANTPTYMPTYIPTLNPTLQPILNPTYIPLNDTISNNKIPHHIKWRLILGGVLICCCCCIFIYVIYRQGANKKLEIDWTMTTGINSNPLLSEYGKDSLTIKEEQKANETNDNVPVPEPSMNDRNSFQDSHLVRTETDTDGESSHRNRATYVRNISLFGKNNKNNYKKNTYRESMMEGN
mmetsp:Transcript_35482/g.43846  ORF Transcript_35482/g.43846 Transcript_35482/m.43846 type:complete len:313 (+) Transcript_35482:35-973(+)